MLALNLPGAVHKVGLAWWVELDSVALLLCILHPAHPPSPSTSSHSSRFYRIITRYHLASPTSPVPLSVACLWTAIPLDDQRCLDGDRSPRPSTHFRVARSAAHRSRAAPSHGWGMKRQSSARSSSADQLPSITRIDSVRYRREQLTTKLPERAMTPARVAHVQPIRRDASTCCGRASPRVRRIAYRASLPSDLDSRPVRSRRDARSGQDASIVDVLRGCPRRPALPLPPTFAAPCRPLLDPFAPGPVAPTASSTLLRLPPPPCR